MKAPAGWTNRLLHHLAEVRTGISKNAKREGPAVKMSYLRVANVQDGFLDLTEVKEIDVPKNQVGRFTLKRDDILLIEGNGNPENLGRGCMWDDQVPDCVHQNHVFAVRIQGNANLLPQFLMLQLQSDHGRNYLLSCAKGSTGLSTLNSEQLRQLPVLLPPIFEQQRITALISSWGLAIEKTERLIAAKEHRLHGLYQRLFGLLSHSHAGWRAYTLSELLAPRNEYAVPSDALPLYSLTIESGVTPKTERYDREFLVKDADAKQYAVVHPGDIVFNPSNLRWGAIARARIDSNVVVSPIYEVLEIQEGKVNGSLLAHVLTCPRQIAYFATKTEGTLIERMAVKLDAFLQTRIYLPISKAEQNMVAALLDEAEHEVDLHKNTLVFLKQQKRGLMQKLLTGHWRVKIPKTEAA